jgi:hypothetical protein
MLVPSILPSLWLVMMFPLTKGAAMRPRISCGLQPCDYHKERVGYLGLWKETYRIYVPYSLIALPFLTNSMGGIKHTNYTP